MTPISTAKEMGEGRKSKIVLLDDRHLDILVRPKLLSSELFDLVASHFNLKEKEYFGLMYKDESNHSHWLQLDRRVLEHDFPRRTGQLVLHFAVRFYVENISCLQDSVTVELFYLQARQTIYQGVVECSSDVVFELAAYVLQAVHGDFVDLAPAKEHLKKLPVLPTRVLQEYPCLSFCEDQVMNKYHKLTGHTRGSCIVSYMTIVENLPSYGIHYYEVKDKGGLPWWLGISFKGISIYDHNDRKTPRRVFAWKQLENLYFRERKFSIEVHDPKRVSVSRRTFGPSSVNVHAWMAASPQLTKCIWTMAVAQHQFYLDRKQSEVLRVCETNDYKKQVYPKTRLITIANGFSLLQCLAPRNMRDIATDLSRSTSSLHSSAAASDGTDGAFRRSSSARSLNASLSSSRTELGLGYGSDDSDKLRAVRDLWLALKARKDAVEAECKRKLEKLKELCLKEADLTGELPPETPLEPGEPKPVIRRRVGTSFMLSPKIFTDGRENTDSTGSNKEGSLASLETEFELQDKITAAYHKLSRDTVVTRSIRRDRQLCYRKAYNKLKVLEKSLNEQRAKAGKPPVQISSSLEDPNTMVSPATVRRRASSQCSTNRDRNYLHAAGTGHPFMDYKQKPVTKTLFSLDAGYTTHQSLQRNTSAPSSPMHKLVPSSVHADGHGGDMVTRCISNDESKLMGFRDQHHQNRHSSVASQHMHQLHRVHTDAPHASGSRTSYPDSTSSSSYMQRSMTSPRNHYHNQTPSSPLVDRRQQHHSRDVNLYNVTANRSTSYNSHDDLKTNVPAASAMMMSSAGWEESSPGWPSKHGSLEGAYRRQLSAGNNSACSLSSGSSLMNTSCLSSVEDVPERSYDTFPRPLTSCFPVCYETPPHLRAVVDSSSESIELSPTGSNDCSTVVKRGQNYVEISKPFEMADVYKYSSRMRHSAVPGSHVADVSNLRSTSSPQLNARGRQLRETMVASRHRNNCTDH